MEKKDLEVLIRLELSAGRALWGAVIPSLRKVLLKWKPGDDTAWLYFYHDGEITDVIEEHYSCVHAEMDADFCNDPRTDYKVIRCDYPTRLPQEEYVIYARREPFEDPTEL
jgi:hypothetical protein